MTDPALPDVHTYLDELVEDKKVPGLQYLVVNSGGVIFEYAGGWADLAEKRPMTPTTTMMAYSMSKTITAVAVLQLAETGQLSLDDNVDRYVDTVPYESVPVRRLLSHTAGVPNPIPLRWAHLPAEDDTFTESAALSRQLKKKSRLASDPGERYRYSNLGYWLLGPIVEAASGQPFAAYVAEHILAPIGATESELGYSVHNPQDHATGYLEKYSFLNVVKRFLLDRRLFGEYEGRWLEVNRHYVDGPAFGGLVGTARGFGKFLQDQLRLESVLLGKDIRALLYRPEQTDDGAEVPMTLGWHIQALNGIRYFYKEGGGGGFHALMRLYPERGVGTVVLTNATAFDVSGLLDTLDPQFPAD